MGRILQVHPKQRSVKAIAPLPHEHSLCYLFVELNFVNDMEKEIPRMEVGGK